MTPLRIATRASAQARTQTEVVAEQLRRTHPGLAVELVFVETTGDLQRDVPLHEIGGQGVFVREVQRAVLDGRADLAVHSAKDLPSITAAGLLLAAVTERRDPRDALIGGSLLELEVGATIATGSVRRRAQLQVLRPDFRFVELRGNIPTRLRKVPEGGAIVMAVAALQVLGLTDTVAHDVLDPVLMVPQVAQGAVAVECRADDALSIARCAAIEHAPSRRDVDVERAFLAELGGGCTLPVGAHVMADPETGARSLGVFLGLGDEPRRWWEPLAGDELAVAAAAARPYAAR